VFDFLCKVIIELLVTLLARYVLCSMECVYVGCAYTSLNSKGDYPVVREAFLFFAMPILYHGNHFIVSYCQVHVTGAPVGLEGCVLAVFIDDVSSVAYDELFQ
jgi:hypothetical protein